MQLSWTLCIGMSFFYANIWKQTIGLGENMKCKYCNLEWYDWLHNPTILQTAQGGERSTIHFTGEMSDVCDDFMCVSDDDEEEEEEEEEYLDLLDRYSRLDYNKEDNFFEIVECIKK